MAGRDGVFVGVDGGGTKTHVVLVDSEGAVLRHGYAGSTNPNSVGAEAAAANLKAALREALGDGAPAVRRVAFAMSGVDRPGDEVPVFEAAAEVVGAAASLHVGNDALGALASGTGGRPHGLVYISGTGQIAYGRNEAGESGRCGGFGCLTDAGSGYAIGLAALRATYAAHDGTGPATTLAARVRARCGVERTEDLIGWTYKDLAFARVASVTPAVFDAAEEGDAVGAAILDEAAAALAHGVSTLAARLGYAEGDAFFVVAAGSVGQRPEIRERVQALVARRFPRAAVKMPEVSSAVGAALLAMHRDAEAGAAAGERTVLK